MFRSLRVVFSLYLAVSADLMQGAVCCLIVCHNSDYYVLYDPGSMLLHIYSVKILSNELIQERSILGHRQRSYSDIFSLGFLLPK